MSQIFYGMENSETSHMANVDNWPPATENDRTYEGTFELTLSQESQQKLDNIFGPQFTPPYQCRYPYYHVTLLLIRFNHKIRTIKDAKEQFQHYTCTKDLEWLHDGLEKTIDQGVDFEFTRDRLQISEEDYIHERLNNGLKEMKDWIEMNWNFVQNAEVWNPSHMTFKNRNKKSPAKGTKIKLTFEKVVFTPRPPKNKQVSIGKIWKGKRFKTF
jgi:hypothetical protein